MWEPKEKFYNVVSRLTVFQGAFLKSQASIRDCWMQARFIHGDPHLAFGIGSSHLPSQEIEAQGDSTQLQCGKENLGLSPAL